MADSNGLDQNRRQVRQALFERLGWQTAERDDRRLARSVAQRDEIDAVHNLDEGGLLDAFMAFLKAIGFSAFLEDLKPARRQRFIVPTCLILYTYMVKTLLAIERMYSVPALLFSDPAVMKLMGFNARWLEEGLSRRSHEKRSEEKEPPKPFCAQMIANFIADLLVKESIEFFNQAIRCLARFGVFPSEVTVVLDGTDIETTEKCQGAGSALREKKVTHRTGRPKTVEVLVFGFKAVVAFDLATQIPVALVVTKIQRHDTLCTKRLIRQAQANLAAGGSQVRKVLVDRGFLDGATMYWLDQQEIAFVVPAKKSMLLHRLACSKAQNDEGYVQSRTETLTHGRGKTKRVEHLTTDVIGIENLRFWDAYNDPQAARQAGRRGYERKPIQAVVVRTWRGETHTRGGHVVYLTNQKVRKPLAVFDDYDGRSLIENNLFREGKQAWALETIPQKTQRAAVAHIAITFALVALTTAYREWMRLEEEEKNLEDIESPLAKALNTLDDTDPQGVRRWRIELKNAVRDYVIVFDGPHYGIFHVMEMMVLGGYRLRELPEELGTPDDIFARYGLKPPD